MKILKRVLISLLVLMTLLQFSMLILAAYLYYLTGSFTYQLDIINYIISSICFTIFTILFIKVM